MALATDLAMWLEQLSNVSSAGASMCSSRSRRMFEKSSPSTKPEMADRSVMGWPDSAATVCGYLSDSCMRPPNTR